MHNNADDDGVNEADGNMSAILVNCTDVEYAAWCNDNSVNDPDVDLVVLNSKMLTVMITMMLKKYWQWIYCSFS